LFRIGQLLLPKYQAEIAKLKAELLVGDGEQVRVLTRDPKAARAAFSAATVEIVGVDFDDAATLRAGFTGSEKAFLSYGTSDRQVRDEIALIDAAIGADVAYLVNLSVAGAGGAHVDSSNVLQWHTEIDAYLATTGVAATVVRPTTFIAGLRQPAAPRRGVRRVERQAAVPVARGRPAWQRARRSRPGTPKRGGGQAILP
jgi:uncharacterized protein YbjT (DUF2867 family)